MSIIHVLTRKEFLSHLKNTKSEYKYFFTAAGTLLISSTALGIYDIKFVDDHIGPLEKQFDEDNIILTGTDFQIKVWKATMNIPVGKTVTYHDLARIIGHKNSYRAVANALGSNKIAYYIPCHRVIRKNGDVGGYGYGSAKKIALLRSENALKK
jgi:O-6-methylguanine DNA methyltransferase